MSAIAMILLVPPVAVERRSPLEKGRPAMLTPVKAYIKPTLTDGANHKFVAVAYAAFAPLALAADTGNT